LFSLINSGGAWQHLIKNMWEIKTISQVIRRLDDSQFWSGLVNVKDEFPEYGKWQHLIKNMWEIKTISQAIRRLGDSQFWSGLVNVKDEFPEYGKFHTARW
jgi:hypothetical protein